MWFVIRGHLLINRSVHAGLQVSMCTVMMCASLVNIQTHRQLSTSYTISSASWAENY